MIDERGNLVDRILSVGGRVIDTDVETHSSVRIVVYVRGLLLFVLIEAFLIFSHCFRTRNHSDSLEKDRVILDTKLFHQEAELDDVRHMHA